LKYGRTTRPTDAMPNPASPITKLAAAMTPAAAAHASVTRRESVARRRGRARAPPGIERRQVHARPQREPRRTLLEEGRDAFPGVRRASGPEHRLRVQKVRVHRMVGAKELQHHMSRNRHRDLV